VSRVVQQRQVFLGLLAFVELLPEAVVGQAEARGRKEVLAIGIAGEGSGLSHQRIDHVPVMHRVLVPTDQSRQRVGQHVRVPDLDAVGVEPGFHTLADQPAMDRVGTAVNVDQASRIDAARHLQTTGQTDVGQVLQRRDLFGEAIASRADSTGPFNIHCQACARQVGFNYEWFGRIVGDVPPLPYPPLRSKLL
jgi:hypothetical protein